MVTGQRLVTARFVALVIESGDEAMFAVALEVLRRIEDSQVEFRRSGW